MKASDIRQMIRNADLRPFAVCMDDGTSYKVTQPDFAILASDTLIIAASPYQDLDGRNFVLCYLEHVSRIELLKKKAKAK